MIVDKSEHKMINLLEFIQLSRATLLEVLEPLSVFILSEEKHYKQFNNDLQIPWREFKEFN